MTSEQKQLIEEFADKRDSDTMHKLVRTFPKNTNYLGLYIFVVMYGELKDVLTRGQIIEGLTMVIDKMNEENGTDTGTTPTS